MRGKLLSTFRLGLSQGAPDHNTIDYAAIRDKHAQLAQPRCFESSFLGKIPLRKVDISFWAFFFFFWWWTTRCLSALGKLMIFTLLGFGAERVQLHQTLGRRGQSDGEGNDRLGNLSEPLLRPALGSGRFNRGFVLPLCAVPASDGLSHNLSLLFTLFIVS